MAYSKEELKERLSKELDDNNMKRKVLQDKLNDAVVGFDLDLNINTMKASQIEAINGLVSQIDSLGKSSESVIEKLIKIEMSDKEIEVNSDLAGAAVEMLKHIRSDEVFKHNTNEPVSKDQMEEQLNESAEEFEILSSETDLPEEEIILGKDNDE